WSAGRSAAARTARRRRCARRRPRPARSRRTPARPGVRPHRPHWSRCRRGDEGGRGWRGCRRCPRPRCRCRVRSRGPRPDRSSANDNVDRLRAMKIAVVGTGAMGSVYAGLLGRAGHEVWAIDTWRDHIDAIAGNGLRVSGASGDYVVDTLHAGSTPEDAGACDLWIIATKAWSVEEAAAAVAPLLRPDDMVMAFQNGLGAADRVARQLPAEHVIIGIAEGFGSSIPEP